MTAIGLTKRQSEAFAFIRQFEGDRGYSPTYQEIADSLGLRAKSGAFRLVQQLRDRGYIAFAEKRGRSIIILRAAA